MKKIISMLAMAVLAVTAMSSCVDDAEVTAYLTPAVKEQIAADDPDKAFSAAVAGIYSDIQSYVNADQQHNYFGHMSFGYLCSLMGNDMIMTGRFGMSLYHYLLDYWQENYVPTSNRWREYYRHVDNANKMIESISPDETKPEVLKYKAVALALRGFGYLHLSYLYGLPYYMGADDTVWGKGQKYDNANTPCVPIVTETITGDQPRSTVGQVYDQIISDLEASYALFQQCDMIKTSTPSDIDGCVAAMYLARAYMIKHDWTKAAQYAQVVIDNYDVLEGRAEILQGFSDINLPDVVFGCDITNDNTTTYMSFFSQMDLFGSGYAAIGVWRAGFRPLVERIPTTDIRLDWFFDAARNGTKLAAEFGLSNYFAAGAWPYVNYQSVKFVGGGRANIQPGTGYCDGWQLGDYIYLRSEEAHFILAEALAHQGDAKAVSVLNDFMATRDAQYNYTFTDKASLIEEIIFQKRVEFWGEGLEYLDNRRLNIPVDRTVETWGNKTNHMSGGQLYASQDDRNFLYQLPLTEIDNNSALTEADQN